MGDKLTSPNKSILPRLITWNEGPDVELLPILEDFSGYNRVTLSKVRKMEMERVWKPVLGLL